MLFYSKGLKKQKEKRKKKKKKKKRKEKTIIIIIMLQGTVQSDQQAVDQDAFGGVLPHTIEIIVKRGQFRSNVGTELGKGFCRMLLLLLLLQEFVDGNEYQAVDEQEMRLVSSTP